MTRTETQTQRVGLYLRISKDHAGDAHGVANQRADCTRYVAARPGWAITREYVDNDVSASNGKRHGDWDRLLADIEAGEIDVALTWAIDRALRGMGDYVKITEACERSGVRLCSVSGNLDFSTDQGETLGGILAVIARGEVKRKAARQVLANAEAARAGKPAHRRRAFGTEPAEAEAIRWAADALLGGGTVSAVMGEWTRRGLAPPQNHGRPWRRNSVATILKNPALAGLRAYRGEIVYGEDGEPVTIKDDHGEPITPILARETWQAVVALLASRDRTVEVTYKRGRLAGQTRTRRVRVRTEAGVRTLGGGLFRCQCGNTLQGSINATRKPVYRCNPETRGERPGPHCQQMISPVDAFVTGVIIARLARPDLADLITPKRPDLTPLHTEAASIRRNLDTLAADMVAGLISRSQMLAATERGNARLADITAQLASAAESSALAPFTAGESARAVWDGLDNSRRRAVIDALCTVVVHPAGRGARTFDPETVEFTWGQR